MKHLLIKFFLSIFILGLIQGPAELCAGEKEKGEFFGGALSGQAISESKTSEGDHDDCGCLPFECASSCRTCGQASIITPKLDVPPGLHFAESINGSRFIFFFKFSYFYRLLDPPRSV